MTTYFDEAARTWDTPEKVERSRLIADALAATVGLDPTHRLLDYGAGTGVVAWFLIDQVAHITLADPSTGMREVAQERLDERGDDRGEVSDLDLTTAGLTDAFDGIYSAMALHHIDDPDATLAAMARAVRPGGWVAVAELDHDPHNNFHDHDFHGHRGFDRDAFAASLQAVGLTQPTIQTVAQVEKERDGVARTFDVFLATARRP